MSESPRMYSEREVVVREREAYDAAVADLFRVARARGGIEHVDARDWAAKSFPLPKVTRPRVVCDPHDDEWDWKCEHGVLRAKLREPYGLWITPGEHGCGMFGITPERVELWAALLASPTEEVPDDAAALTDEGGETNA